MIVTFAELYDALSVAGLHVGVRWRGGRHAITVKDPAAPRSISLTVERDFDQAAQVLVMSLRLRERLGARGGSAELRAPDRECCGRWPELLDLWPPRNGLGGYLRGLQEARRVADGAGATLLLLSDGHANEGITEAAELQSIAVNTHRQGVTTATLGLGLGYDELLMTGLARGGSGNHVFAEEGDTAGRLIAAEVDGLLSQTAQAVSLIIRPAWEVAELHLWNDLPVAAIDGGVMVELGDLYGGEARKLVLTLAVPSMGALEVGDLGEAEQDAKRKASDALRRGDSASAARFYGEAGDVMSAAMSAAPPGMAEEMSDASELLRDLARRAIVDDASRVAKFTDADRARKGRQRGR